MTKEKFYTKRWNNWLTLGLGIPTLAYGVFVLSTSVMSDFAGFIGMVALALVFWPVIEGHSARRSAWQRKTVGGPKPKLRGARRFIFFVYNIIYWLPMVLPFTPVMDYSTGFILLFSLIVIKTIINAYRTNFLTLEQGERFPLRIATWRPS